MQKNLVKLSYLAQKVLQRGRVPVLQLVDLPSMLTQNNGRKMPIFVTPCILPSHTGFKNIFSKRPIFLNFFGLIPISFSSRNYWSLLNQHLIANVYEKAKINNDGEFEFTSQLYYFYCTWLFLLECLGDHLWRLCGIAAS